MAKKRKPEPKLEPWYVVVDPDGARVWLSMADTPEEAKKIFCREFTAYPEWSLADDDGFTIGQMDVRDHTPQITDCAFCGRPGEYLCDFMMARRGANGLWNGQEPRSCDRPMCEKCRTNVGVQFWDGDASVTGIESVDYCPKHAAMAKHADIDLR